MNDALYFSELCARRRGLLTLSQGALVRGLARLEDVGVAAFVRVVLAAEVVVRAADLRGAPCRIRVFRCGIELMPETKRTYIRRKVLRIINYFSADFAFRLFWFVLHKRLRWSSY